MIIIVIRYLQLPTRASRARHGGAAGSPPIPREDPYDLIETWVSFFGSLSMVQLLVETASVTL